MPPKALYEIPESAYLFGKTPSPDKPEEKVRQWGLFELLSTYGIPITRSVVSPMSIVITRKLSDVRKCLIGGFVQLCYLVVDLNDPKLPTDVILQGGLIGRLVTVLQYFKEYFELIGYDGRTEHSTIRYRIDKRIRELETYIENENKDYAEYFAKLEKIEDIPHMVLWEIMSFAPCLRELARRYADLPNHEAALLGACEVVARYLEERLDSTASPTFSEGQIDHILRVFELTFLVPLNLCLPTKLDPVGTQNLHDFCEYYWQTCVDIDKYIQKNPPPELDVKVIMPGDPEYESWTKAIVEAFEDNNPDGDASDFDGEV